MTLSTLLGIQASKATLECSARLKVTKGESTSPATCSTMTYGHNRLWTNGASVRGNLFSSVLVNVAAEGIHLIDDVWVLRNANSTTMASDRETSRAIEDEIRASKAERARYIIDEKITKNKRHERNAQKGEAQGLPVERVGRSSPRIFFCFKVFFSILRASNLVCARNATICILDYFSSFIRFSIARLAGIVVIIILSFTRRQRVQNINALWHLLFLFFVVPVVVEFAYWQLPMSW